MSDDIKRIEDKVDQILNVLVGDLDKPGFIEQTKSDFNKVDYRLTSLEGTRKFSVGTVVSLVVAWLGSIFLGL